MIGYKKKEESKLHLLTDASLKEIDVWINKYPADKKQSAVVPALFYAQGENNGWLKERLLLTATVAADKGNLDAAYEVEKIQA